ncbi:MAG: hypothetical protein HQ485_16960 [Acidobacteria bacterium]|nr:hypothetical protein [Acidobacteriota bacterium]
MLDALKRLSERAAQPDHQETVRLLDDLREAKTELLGLLSQAAAQRSEWQTATAIAEAWMDERLKQQQQAQQLASTTMQARATLQTLSTEQASLDALTNALRTANDDLQAARALAAGVTASVSDCRSGIAQVVTDQDRVRDLAQEARDDASAAAVTVREVEPKLAGLIKLQELAKTLDQRVGALNALTEHVTLKARVLDQQKHTVEQAILAAHRLSEMVANMDEQVVRLEGTTQEAQRAEEQAERVGQLVRESAQQLEDATRRREAFVADLARLEEQRGAAALLVRTYVDRLSGERRALDASQVRLANLQESVAGLERAHQGLSTREPTVAALMERLSQLEIQMMSFGVIADEVAKKVATVESVRTDLQQLDETARRAVWQMESLKASRLDLEELRSDIEAFYVEHAEAIQMRDRLSADRQAIEGFMERTTVFAATLPDLDGRLTSVREKLSTVEEGTQKAANLVLIADDLDRHMTRLTGYQQFVERLDGRLNTLNSMTADVDRRLTEQIARQAEVDALRASCDGVQLRVSDLRHQLDAVGQEQSRVLTLVEQVDSLRTEVDRAQKRLAAATGREGTGRSGEAHHHHVGAAPEALRRNHRAPRPA